jgi:hypothetical protein
MRVRPLIPVVLVLPLLGCGGGDAAPQQAPPPDTAAGLQELGEIYHYRAAQKLPAPAKVEDLAEHDAALENALPAIRQGDIVVVWRIGYAAGSTDVLAYTKGASTAGGKVLLRNGTVKDVAAGEFKAPKKP